MLYNLLTSLWRTAVPYIVSFAVVQLARLGMHLDSASLTAELVVAGGTAYYALFRVLEEHVSPRWGWLLGLARPPQYPTPDGGTVAPAPQLGSGG